MANTSGSPPQLSNASFEHATVFEQALLVLQLAHFWSKSELQSILSAKHFVYLELMPGAVLLFYFLISHYKEILFQRVLEEILGKFVYILRLSPRLFLRLKRTKF